MRKLLFFIGMAALCVVFTSGCGKDSKKSGSSTTSRGGAYGYMNCKSNQVYTEFGCLTATSRCQQQCGGPYCGEYQGYCYEATVEPRYGSTNCNCSGNQLYYQGDQQYRAGCYPRCNDGGVRLGSSCRYVADYSCGQDIYGGFNNFQDPMWGYQQPYNNYYNYNYNYQQPNPWFWSWGF